jgi:hypothetical protein
MAGPFLDQLAGRLRVYPFTGLRLLLPAIIPSWRFFDAVAASPRVDYAITPAPDTPNPAWAEYAPRPARVTPGAMARRMVWNAPWNEALYLVSLSERLIQHIDAHTTRHSERELLIRVARGLNGCEGYLTLRIRLERRVGERVQSHIAHVTPPHAIAGLIGA